MQVRWGDSVSAGAWPTLFHVAFHDQRKYASF
jgi:hypothetical protein